MNTKNILNKQLKKEIINILQEHMKKNLLCNEVKNNNIQINTL